MQFDAFTALIQGSQNPLILLEGRRSIPESAARSARRVATMLAGQFPQLRFRSGNATGTDQAFAAGIIETAPKRLEIIAPDPRHRLRDRHPLVRYDSPESLAPAVAGGGGTAANSAARFSFHHPQSVAFLSP